MNRHLQLDWHRLPYPMPLAQLGNSVRVLTGSDLPAAGRCAPDALQGIAATGDIAACQVNGHRVVGNASLVVGHRVTVKAGGAP